MSEFLKNLLTVSVLVLVLCIMVFVFSDYHAQVHAHLAAVTQ